MTSPPPIALLFTGQGSQRVGAGAALYHHLPSFQEDIQRCQHLLQEYLPKPLQELLFSPKTTEKELSQTSITQPALFSLGYSLARLWQRWGLRHQASLGHSLGEYTAACLAGVFPLERALPLVAQRAALMQALPQDGQMLVVLADAETTERARQPFSQRVSIAAYNAPNNTVLSGHRDDIQAIQQALASQGIQSVRLFVSHAFHSPLMRPVLKPFLQAAQRIPFRPPPHQTLIANRTGRFADTSIANATYWRMHILEPVHFMQSIETLFQQGVRIFLEIGPRPTLLKLAKQCHPPKDTIFLSSLHPKRTAIDSLREATQTLTDLGVPLNQTQLTQDLQKLQEEQPTTSP